MDGVTDEVVPNVPRQFLSPVRVNFVPFERSGNVTGTFAVIVAVTDEIGLTVGVAEIGVGVGNIVPELSLPQPDIIKIASKQTAAKIK